MNIQKGQIIEGTVKSIQTYGAFVDIGNGQIGLVHINDLSISRIKTPYDRVKIGQKLNFMVKSIEEETGKVSLSYKAMLGTWEENVKNFKEGTKVYGIARDKEKNNNGIFIELTPNLVGMAEYKDDINYGDNVEVYIKKILPEKKKIKLIIQ